MFDVEISRLEKKIKSGLVSSIWIQFGTDYKLLKSRIEILSNMLSVNSNNNSKVGKISLFGSILIPSRQFLARFKYRPWKGVYCSNEFLKSEEIAHEIIINLLKTYKFNKICPLIETGISTDKHLDKLKNIFNS